MIPTIFVLLSIGRKKGGNVKTCHFAIISKDIEYSRKGYIVDAQQSQCFGETHYGHVFSDVVLRYPSDGSVFWMLLGVAMRKILGMFHICHIVTSTYHSRPHHQDVVVGNDFNFVIG